MGPPPTLCTHLASALATSTRGRSLCIHDVYAKHMGTCTRRHHWRPQRGRVEDTVQRTSVQPPGGRRNTSKSNSPDVQADAKHTLLFLLPRDEDVASANDVRGDVGRRCVYDWWFGEGKGFDSPPELVYPSARTFSEKKEKRKTQAKVSEKLTSIIVIYLKVINNNLLWWLGDSMELMKFFI